MNAFLKSSFSLLVIVPAIASAAAVEVKFADFLGKFVQQSSSVQRARSTWMVAKAEFDKNSSVSPGTLSLAPFYQWTETDGAQTFANRDTSGPEMSGEWEQNLPVGLRAKLGASQFWSSEGTETIYSAELEQALWKNAFGVSQKNLRRAAEASLGASKLNYIHEFVLACAGGVTSYLDAWKADALAAAAKESYELSQAVLRNTRGNFQKKLVSSLDYNSAKVDALSTEDSYENLRVDAQAKLATVLSYFAAEGGADGIKIQQPLLPDAKTQEFPANAVLLDVRFRREAKAAREAAYLAAKTQNRTAVNLFAGFEQTESNYDGGLNADAQQWEAQVGFRIAWPMFDKTLSAAEAIAKAELMRAESELHEAERTSRIELDALRSQVENFRGQLVRSDERLKLRNAQVKEARRLLNIGRIDFEDYVRYRDDALAEISKNAEVQKSLWTSHLAMLEKFEQVPPICGPLQL